MEALSKIGFGGGCHWCTEAVFQSLEGVHSVEQGWIASDGEAFTFSEAVIVRYNSNRIPLNILLEVHLHTHKSTSEHSMRKKYRSAVYFFNNDDQKVIKSIIKTLQPRFENKLVTQILPFKGFKPSGDNFKDYYYKNPQKPFCETFINPKLNVLLYKFTNYVVTEKLQHLKK